MRVDSQGEASRSVPAQFPTSPVPEVHKCLQQPGLAFKLWEAIKNSNSSLYCVGGAFGHPNQLERSSGFS